MAGEFAREDYNDRDIITAMVGRTIDQLYPTRDSEFSQDEVLRVEDLTIAHPIIANRNMVEGVSFSSGGARSWASRDWWAPAAARWSMPSTAG